MNVLAIHSFVNYIFTFSAFFVSRGSCLKMISDLSNFISSVVVFNVSMRHQQVLKEKRNYIYMIDITVSFLSKGSTENFKNCTVTSKKPTCVPIPCPILVLD